MAAILACIQNKQKGKFCLIILLLCGWSIEPPKEKWTQAVKEKK